MEYLLAVRVDEPATADDQALDIGLEEMCLKLGALEALPIGH